MLATFNLEYCPFAETVKVKGPSNQYITLHKPRKQVIYSACSSQRQRIFFHVCDFMAKTIKANATKQLDTSRLEQTLQPWMDDTCAISFRGDTNRQSAVESKAINEGRRLILEGLGLNQSNYVSHEESSRSTPPEGLVTAPTTEPAEPTTRTIQIPISDTKSLALTLPIELTIEEVNLIANSSLEYLKALIVSQYKE
jgi:hypothetical protein